MTSSIPYLMLFLVCLCILPWSIFECFQAKSYPRMIVAFILGILAIAGAMFSAIAGKLP